MRTIMAKLIPIFGIVLILSFASDRASATSLQTVHHTAKPPRNLWDHWQESPVSIRRIGGIAWDGRSLWLLDSARKMVYRTDDRRQTEALRFPEDASVGGLTFDGKAFWTYDSKNKCFRSVTLNSTGRKVPWSGGISNQYALAYVNGELLFVSPNKRRILCLNLQAGSVVRRLPSPCRLLTAMAWDGRYLWCLRDKGMLLGYDLERQLVFTSFKLKEEMRWLAIGGEKVWGTLDVGPGRANQIPIYHFPMPRNGDVCMGEVETRVQVIAGGITPKKKVWSKTVTVQIDNIPLDDINQKVLEVRFEPVDGRKQDYEDFTRSIIIPKVQLGQKGEASVRGHIKYAYRPCWYVLIPDEMGDLSDIPERVRNRFLQEHDNMKPEIVVNAAKQAAGDETHPYWKMRRIHDWIGQNLSQRRAEVDQADQANEEEVPMRLGLAGVLERKRAVCGGYSGVMYALCRLNKIPCRTASAAGSSGSHAWNLVWLPGVNGWIDVDVMKDDRPSEYNYMKSRLIGWRRGLQMRRGPREEVPPQITTDKSGNPVIEFPTDLAVGRIDDGNNIPPACYGKPVWRVTSDRYLEMRWAEGYDYEDGTDLTYEIYVSTERMQKKFNQGRCVKSGLKQTSWRVEGLEPADKYFIRIVAVDKAGQRSADASVSGKIRQQVRLPRALLRRYVWNRKK